MRTRYSFLWLMVILVVTTGLFFPRLMDTDAPEYAGVAMRMYQTGHWYEMINRSYADGKPFDYLEKPHMVYWSALPGYALFGIHDYAYRLLSVLLSLAAALALSRTAAMLYNRSTGRAAALMFLSAQAILLANHDVRTDSLLTSFCMLTLWQIISYLQRNKWLHLVWAALFLACAIASKGMIAILVCAGATAFYLIGKRRWRAFADPRWLLLLFFTGIFLSPVLYCYYLQFDLHPEKLVNGHYGVSGIRHLLWSQSFERFSGTGDFTRESPEFIFFFHTMLWAFLPWSVLCYSGVFARLKELWTSRGRSFFSREQLSFTGVWVLFLLMSFSRIKLPHYINVLFPLMSLFTAGYLYQLATGRSYKALRRFGRYQLVQALLLSLGVLVLNFWAFPVKDYRLIAVWALIAAGALWYYRRLKPDAAERVWIPSVIVMLWVNLLLHTHFYPALDTYQGGSAMAALIDKKQYNKQDIYLYGYVSRSFDFYMQQWSPMLSDEEIRQKKEAGKEVLLFTDAANLENIKQHFPYMTLETLPDFHITALDLPFLNPATRSGACGRVYLVRVLSPVVRTNQLSYSSCSNCR